MTAWSPGQGMLASLTAEVAEGRMNDLQVASLSFVLSVEKKMTTGRWKRDQLMRGKHKVARRPLLFTDLLCRCSTKHNC